MFQRPHFQVLATRLQEPRNVIQVLAGPRQVGKTTLAKELQKRLNKPSIYLDLELDEDLIRLQNAQSYLQSHQDK